MRAVAACLALLLPKLVLACQPCAVQEESSAPILTLAAFVCFPMLLAGLLVLLLWKHRAPSP